jgi:hypothetical protein
MLTLSELLNSSTVFSGVLVAQALGFFSTNINRTNNHLSNQMIEHKTNHNCGGVKFEFHMFFWKISVPILIA